MTGEGFALAREELIRTLTAYSGVTTADGSSGKNTLIDSALIGKNDFLTGKSVLIMSGAAQYETAGITDFDSNTGEITFTPLSARIVVGVSFRVLNVLPESVHISSGQVQIMGWDYESGEWRNVRVTGSGEIAIHVTVADIVTAKISGQSVVVTSGQVGIKGYDLLSGEWRPIVVNESGELAIHVTVADIVTARVSGIVAVVSGEVHVMSGELIAKVSGQTVTISSGAISVVSGEVHVMSGELIAKVSGQAVKVSGQSVVVTSGQVGIKGYDLLSGEWRNILVNASGEIIARISGDVVKISGEAVKISGESVVVTSGQVVAKISGESVVVTSGQVVAKISGESVVVTSGQVVAKISGETVSLPTTQQVIAKVSGETVSLPVSQVVKVSGEIIIAKVSGETISIAVPTAIVHFQQTIPDSATQLTAGAVKSAVVKALTANSGMIYMGDSDVSTANGFELDAGEAASADIDNTNRLYAIASVSGDKICALGVN